MWLPFYEVFDLPLRIVVFLPILLAAYFYARKNNHSNLFIFPHVLSIIKVSIAIYFLITVMVLISKIFGGGLNFSGSYIRLLFGILTAITIFYIIDTDSKLEKFMNVYIIICLISSVVAIYQFLGFRWAYDVQIFLQSSVPKFSTKEFIGSNYRPGGLALFSILFSYHVSSIFPIVFALALYSKKLKRVIYLFFSVIFLLSSISSLTRSAVFAIILSLIYIYKVRYNYGKAFIFISLLSAIILFVFSLFEFDNDLFFTFIHRISNPTDGPHDRWTLFFGNILVSLYMPFGLLGNYNWWVSSNIDLFSFLNQPRDLLLVAPHNQFLNMSTNYGILGAILLVYFYFIIFRELNRLKSYTNTHSYFTALRIGLIGSFLSYIINSMAHNGGPFFGELVSWHYIGIYLVFVRMALTQKANNLIYT